MPSFIPDAVNVTYDVVCDLKLVAGITRKSISVQNQSNSIVWIRVGEETDVYKQEFAFLPNFATFFDYASDLLRNKIYIKAESAFSGRKVIISFW
jgi:outer membrane receptor for Fe3+-dicitrate